MVLCRPLCRWSLILQDPKSWQKLLKKNDIRSDGCTSTLKITSNPPPPFLWGYFRAGASCLARQKLVGGKTKRFQTGGGKKVYPDILIAFFKYIFCQLLKSGEGHLPPHTLHWPCQWLAPPLPSDKPAEGNCHFLVMIMTRLCFERVLRKVIDTAET